MNVNLRCNMMYILFFNPNRKDLIRVRKIFSRLSVFFFLLFIGQGHAEPVTVLAQLGEMAQALSDEASKEEKADDPETNAPVEKENEKKDGDDDSSTKIIVPPQIDEANKAPATLDTKLVLSQLEHLRALKDTYEKQHEQTKTWSKWTCLKHSFKLGAEDPALVVVKKQLAEHGYFPFSCDDPEEREKELTPIFDEKLMNAVKHFQKYHLLDDDGVIGLKTCRALNLSPAERIKKMELNIKRWEKIEPDLKGKHVLVNIPTYNLYAMEDSCVALSQPVIVGSKIRQTPLFTTLMLNIVLNPPWGVPVKIFVEDKLRKVLANPDYLEQHHYTVMDREGQEIPSNMVDWSHVSKHYFPYTVRQQPGKYNALGNIKFILDNKDAIYMHGTPEVTLFSRASRAFSSGCIRLSAPRELAVWALKGTRYDSPEIIEEKIKGQKTTTVSLLHHIPVHLIYITVWVDGEGKPLFSDDPYQFDNKAL